MNRNQQIAIGIWAAAVFVMLIFPPFQLQAKGAISSMGYAFILDPPKRGQLTAVVDSGLLAVQWLGVLVLTALAVLMLNRSDRPARGATHRSLDSLAQSDERSASTVKLGSKDHFHPWKRFFARTIDVFTFGFFLMFFVLGSIVVPAMAPDAAVDLIATLNNPIAASFYVYLAWIPLEAVLISRFGTTPGKWLFGIQVLDVAGFEFP